MKLQTMTHGEPNQYKSSKDVMLIYRNDSGSSHHQVNGAQPIFGGKYHSPAVAVYPHSASMPPTTSNSVLRENDDSIMSNDDLLRVAEEQLRPLIKEELRQTIQCKRAAKGLPAHVEIEYKRPQPEAESPADLLRRQRRRDRNKIAAAKCRFKKRMLSEKLIEESEKLENHNQQLKMEAKRLQEERQMLMFILNLHRPSCIVRSPPCTEVSPMSITKSYEDLVDGVHEAQPSASSSSEENHTFAALMTGFIDDQPFCNTSSTEHRTVITHSDSTQYTT